MLDRIRVVSFFALYILLASCSNSSRNPGNNSNEVADSQAKPVPIPNPKQTAPSPNKPNPDPVPVPAPAPVYEPTAEELEQLKTEQNLAAALDNHNFDQIDQLSQKLDINRFKMNGKPVLIWSLKQNKPRLVELLLKNGANPDLDPKYFGGKKPLAWALDNREFALAIGLVKKGVSLNEKNDQGDTPLCQATMLNNYDLFMAMLDHHAELNAQCHEGKTALHLAHELRQPNFSHELESRNADNQILDDHQKRAEAYERFDWTTWNFKAWQQQHKFAEATESLSKKAASRSFMENDKIEKLNTACKELLSKENRDSKKAYRAITRLAHPDKCRTNACQATRAIMSACKEAIGF